jgi:aspartate 1-decarboxylase
MQSVQRVQITEKFFLPYKTSKTVDDILIDYTKIARISKVQLRPL